MIYFLVARQCKFLFSYILIFFPHLRLLWKSSNGTRCRNSKTLTLSMFSASLLLREKCRLFPRIETKSPLGRLAECNLARNAYVTSYRRWNARLDFQLFWESGCLSSSQLRLYHWSVALVCDVTTLSKSAGKDGGVCCSAKYWTC